MTCKCNASSSSRRKSGKIESWPRYARGSRSRRFSCLTRIESKKTKSFSIRKSSMSQEDPHPESHPKSTSLLTLQWPGLRAGKVAENVIESQTISDGSKRWRMTTRTGPSRETTRVTIMEEKMTRRSNGRLGSASTKLTRATRQTRSFGLQLSRTSVKRARCRGARAPAPLTTIGVTATRTRRPLVMTSSKASPGATILPAGQLEPVKEITRSRLTRIGMPLRGECRREDPSTTTTRIRLLARLLRAALWANSFRWGATQRCRTRFHP